MFRVYAWRDRKMASLKEFIETLASEGNSDAERLIFLISRTADHGPPQNDHQCKSLEDGLFEFKAPRGARVVWFYEPGKLIICTHGFVKKADKTPKTELDRAKKIRDACQRELGKSS